MRNKLFTSTIDKLLFKQYKLGSDLSKQKVVAKIFNPYGEGRWFLLNSDPDDPDYLWAIVSMHGNVEIGSVSRNELMNLRLTKYGLPLERDLYFSPKNAQEVYQGLLEGKHFAKGGIVGLSVSGYTIKGRKGNYYIHDVQGRLVEKTYETLDEVKKAFDRLVVMRAHQKHESKSMSETLADVDRFYAKGGGVGSWESLTIEKMQKNFPFNLSKLNVLLRDVCKDRDDAVVTNFEISWQSNKYDTFANFVLDAEIYLKETGSDSVSPSGTYHSKKGLSIIIYLRQNYYSDGSISEITINASKNVAGGMQIYKSRDVDSYSDISNYITLILKDNPKNNLDNFVYAKGGMTSGSNDLYVSQLANMSGTRAVAVKGWIASNNLSDDDVLNIIQGLGRKQIATKEFINAVLGDKKATMMVVDYAKSGKGIKMAQGGDVKIYYAIVDENTDRIYVRNSDKTFIDKKYKELKEIYPNDKLSIVEFPNKMAKGGKVDSLKSKILEYDKYQFGGRKGLGNKNPMKFSPSELKNKSERIRAIFSDFQKDGYSKDDINHALDELNYSKYAKGGGVGEIDSWSDEKVNKIYSYTFDDYESKKSTKQKRELLKQQQLKFEKSFKSKYAKGGEIYSSLNVRVGDEFATILPETPQGGELVYGLIVDEDEHQSHRNKPNRYSVVDLKDQKRFFVNPYWGDKYLALGNGEHKLVIEIPMKGKTLLKDLIYDDLRSRIYELMFEYGITAKQQLPPDFRTSDDKVYFLVSGHLRYLYDYATSQLPSLLISRGSKLYSEPTKYKYSIIWQTEEFKDFVQYRSSEPRTLPSTYVPLYVGEGVVDSKPTKTTKSRYQYADGGGIDKRVILSFSFNTDNIKLDDVTEIVENYTKDWRTGGDIFEPYFYVNLRESEANELKDELESYGYFNDIEIEDSRYQYADGGELDSKKKVEFDEGGETSDQHYEPTYLMTLDEYIKLGIPTTIKNYEKFIKKNQKYLARAGYSGLDYWTLEDALESSKNPFEEYSNYDWIRNIEELGGTTRIDYARAKDFDNWSDTKYTQDPTPIDIRVENQVFREKLSKYFPHRTHKYKEKTWTTSGMQRIENEFKKTNKVAIRDAMQDGVYKKLLNTGKISIDRLKEITDSVGVRITKDTLSGDKKVEFMEGLKKTLSGLPQKSFDKVKEFAEDFHKELKEISDIVYEREYARLSDVILSFVGKRIEMSRVSMAIPISLFSIYDYTSEEIEGKTKYYYDRITMVDIKALQPNWEKYLKDYVKYYVEKLKWNIVSVMADVFRKVTIPIKSYQKISLERGVNGFEGSYKFNFEDGSSFVVNTQGVGAGGYNIQVFHYRYLTNITNATLPSGEVTKDLSHWEKRFAMGGEIKKHYRHKYIPTMTLEVLDYTFSGVKGLQKDSKSLSPKERKDGKIVFYSKSDLNDLFEEDYAKGGLMGYERLVKKVAKNYEGKSVPKEYQSEYGKKYDKSEAKEVGYKVATKVYGKPLARMKK